MIEQKTTREELIHLINILPENEIISVKRFIEFIISQAKSSFQSDRQKERDVLVKELRGACSHLPGGSEEFMRAKHEEIDLEEKKLEEKLL
ncbi:MAG: hypothetical protein ABRQ39_05000 [Candidatus Eremiobacterota bacterium]